MVIYILKWKEAIGNSYQFKRTLRFILEIWGNVHWEVVFSGSHTPM